MQRTMFGIISVLCLLVLKLFSSWTFYLFDESVKSGTSPHEHFPVESLLAVEDSVKDQLKLLYNLTLLFLGEK